MKRDLWNMWPWPKPQQTPWLRQRPTRKIWSYIKEGKCAILSTITLNSWKCIKLWLKFFVLFERRWKLQLLVFLQPSALLITICVKFCLGNLNWIERAAILITILCAFFGAVRRPTSQQQRWPRRSRLTLKVARALTGSGMNADPPTHSAVEKDFLWKIRTESLSWGLGLLETFSYSCPQLIASWKNL